MAAQSVLLDSESFSWLNGRGPDVVVMREEGVKRQIPTPVPGYLEQIPFIYPNPRITFWV